MNNQVFSDRFRPRAMAAVLVTCALLAGILAAGCSKPAPDKVAAADNLYRTDHKAAKKPDSDTAANEKKKATSDDKKLDMVLSPGCMKLASKTEVPLPPKPPLIDNGNFEDWVAGAPVPQGFRPTSNTSVSYMEKETQEVGEGNIAMKQNWQANDANGSVDSLFGIILNNLKPNTTYKFETKAKHVAGEGAGVAAWQTNPQGKLDRLALAIVTITPEMKEYKDLAGTFKTGPGRGPVQIVTYFIGKENKFPTTVIWDSWKLTEVKK